MNGVAGGTTPTVDASSEGLPKGVVKARPEALRTRTATRNRVRPVDWLWRGRIPIGRLSLLVAEEGTGKGVLGAWLTAQIVTGKLGGARHGCPASVLIVGDEDGFDDTWVPRLLAAGLTWDQIATHVHTLAADELLDLERDSTRLTTTVRELGIGWVLIDQLLDHVDAGKDGSGVYNPKRVRQALAPLRRAARDAEVAVTGNLHPIKGSPRSFRELVGGSHQFNAAARSSLWLGVDPDSEDPQSRVLVRAKGNIGQEPPCFEFDIASREFDFDGRDFDEPTVTNARDGERYRRDFEGGNGRAFGKASTLPKHELRGPEIEEALDADIPQQIAALARRLELGDQAVSKTLHWLAEQGRAHKAGDGKHDGWLRSTTDRPALA